MKTIKPLSSKKPPVPNESLDSINEWIEDSRPKINPLIRKLDALVRSNLKKPRYAVKWGNAYYGTVGKGWLIQLAAYDISVNIVFLNGEKLSNPPELGGETRYLFCVIQLALKVPVDEAIRTGLVATPLFLIGSYALRLFGEPK